MNASFARFACLLLPLAAACGGVDPTQLSGRHDMGGPATDGTLPSDGTSGATATADGAASTSSSGGSTGGAVDDAGAAADSAAAADGAPSTTPPPPAANAFTGAGAFVSQLGPSTRKSSHDFPGNTPTTSPMGQACKNCHGFFMGGTVFADAAGTIPAPGVEVRARDNAGNAVSAWTDQDGNFYVPSAGAVTMPAHIGVRNAATTKLMSSTISSGTCASSACHVAGKQGAIHLP
ncbi:MAG: hypothetical protein JWO86_4775 [Myxococcaceae bacterium]|jgi:hypothetical protein|nr:hypothetical protein [Myxococcaceae bacterium]MEA2746212.1 hypothetical protein [Myxococcales bacterium]